MQAWMRRFHVPTLVVMGVVVLVWSLALSILVFAGTGKLVSTPSPHMMSKR